MILITVVILCLILLITFRAEYIRGEILKNEKVNYDALQLSTQIHENFEDSSELIILYTFTNDEQYKKQFYDTTGLSSIQHSLSLDNLAPISFFNVYLNKIQRLQLTDDEHFILAEIAEHYNKLIQFNLKAIYAMEGLYPDETGKYTVHSTPNKTLAESIIVSDDYVNIKQEVDELLAQFVDSINIRTKNQFLALETMQNYNLLFIELLILIGFIFSFIMYLYKNTCTLKLINVLLEQVKQVSNKDFTTRYYVSVNNELGTLNKTFNNMCDEIESNIKQLSELNASLSESEMRFRSIIENSPLAIGLISLDTTFLDMNESLCQLVGYNRNELLHMSIKDILYSEDLKMKSLQLTKLMENKLNYFSSDIRFVHKNGHLIWVLLNISLIKTKLDEPSFLVFQAQNISDRKESETQLQELNKTITSTLMKARQNEKEATFLNKFNESLQICITSDEIYQRTRLTLEQLLPHLSGGLSIFNPTLNILETVEQWGINQVLKQTFSPNECFGIRSGNINIIDDPTKVVNCSHFIELPPSAYMGLPMILQNELIGIIYLFAPIGKLISKHEQHLAINFGNVVKLALVNVKLREKLQHQSIHDPLTGLYNRRYMEETLVRELHRASRNKSTLYVVMIDIDFFKKLNDEFGHEAGDEALKFIGGLLRDKFRETDIACRYGGEEFLLVLSDTDLKNAISRLEHVCDEVRNAHIFFQGKRLPPITLSVGVATAPTQGNAPEIIIQSADQALYVAKESGRNRIEIFQG